MIRTARIFAMFLWRDIITYWKARNTYIINYGIIYPCLYGFVFLYIQSHVLFSTTSGKTALMGTTMFVGNILLTLMTLSYKIAIELLFDLEQDRFIEYQISLLPPRIALIERITFISLFTFTMLLPYFPVAKLLLRDNFVTTNSSWFSVAAVLLASSLFCASYHLLASCVLKNSSNLTKFWVRLNQPLLILGGFWVPFYAIERFSPTLKYICYANPFMYITDGLRRAIIGGEEYLSVMHCITMLIAFSVFCTVLCCYFFKKRVDHI